MAHRIVRKGSLWAAEAGGGNGGDGNGGNGSDVTPRFSDSFNSGDDSHSENGVSWGSTTAVVTDNPRTGTHSMRFRYPANQSTNRESRFNLPGLQRVWLEYYLWVPENFHHPSGSPNNQKLLRCWGGSYAQANPSSGGSFRRLNSNGDSYGYFQWSGEESTIDDQDPTSHWDLFTDATRGTWVQLRWQLNLASGPEAGDGVLKLWQNGVIQVDSTDGDLRGPGGGREPENWYGTGQAGNTLTEGYLMGFANIGYPEQTTFYIDDFKVYDEDPGW